MKRKIAYTTSRLNKNLENILADDAKKRKLSERSLNSGLLSLQYSSTRFSDYRILSAEFLEQASDAQMIDHNPSKAKEYLYLSAICQKFVCLYYTPGIPKTDGPWEVDLHQTEKFEAAVIADANDLALELGGLLLNIEGSVIHPFQVDRGNALFGLFSENTERVKIAIQSLKNGNYPHFNSRGNDSARRLGQAFEDIISRNEQGFIQYLAEQLSKERRGYNVGNLLNIDLIALSKIAVKYGLNVELDTIECPKELIIPEISDYSLIEIPTPKEGFPWSKA